MKAFKKKVSKKKMYREYVNVLNGNLQLSYREADVFAILLEINAEWGKMVEELGSVLSTDSKRVLMRETRISKTNLARYITALKNKGVLVESEKGGLVIDKMFVPDFMDKTCEVLFVLEVE